MTESAAAAYRRAVGNFCLHHAIAKREPRSFLHRNLETILDQHEKSPVSNNKDFANALRTDEDMSLRKRDLAWVSACPSREVVQQMIGLQKPALQVQHLTIQRQESEHNSRHLRSTRGNHGSKEPDWLQGTGSQLSKPCHVYININQLEQSPSLIHMDSVPGNIRHIPNEDRFEITLDKPLIVTLDKIHIKAQSGPVGSNRWKRKVAASYELRVTVDFRNLQDSVEVLAILEGKRPTDVVIKNPNDSKIRAYWDHLPMCPGDHELLPISRTFGHKKVNFDYGLAVSMSWSRPDHESLLAAHNSRVYMRSASTPQQLPTPSASDDLEPSESTVSITYSFEQSRRIVVTDYKCPLCVLRAHFTSFDRLHLHLLTHHDHFNFDVEDTKENNSGDIRKLVKLSLPEKIHERTGQDEREFQWIAPNRPFNKSAYFQGSDAWSTQPLPKALKKPRGRFARAIPADTSAAVVNSSVRSSLAPDEIQDIPGRRARKHRVPNVPGVNFYRTNSKRPLQPSETVSDSDEEVNNTWLVERQRMDLQNLSLSEGAREFIQDFNLHIEEEQSYGDMLAREGVVRFARKHQIKMQRPEWRQEFEDKLQHLREYGIIDEQVRAYCLELNPVAKPARQCDRKELPSDERENPTALKQTISSGIRKVGVHDRRRYDPTQNTFVPSSNGGSEEQRAARESTNNDTASTSRNTVTQTVQNGLCVCRHIVTTARSSIMCDNPRCKRGPFHLKCVGLDARRDSWRCRDCMAQGE